MTERLLDAWSWLAFHLFMVVPHGSWLWWKLLPWAGRHAHKPPREELAND